MKMKMKGVEAERKRNISVQYDIANTLSLLPLNLNSNKKLLRRLPHVFNTVLQLPLRSDADVSVEETPQCFRFVAETHAALGHVEAHTLHIHPGVTKIVVRASGSLHFSLDDLQLDIWRFRLPKSTRPDLATAEFVHGALVVTVPKAAAAAADGDGDGDENNNTAAIGGGAANLVLVQ